MMNKNKKKKERSLRCVFGEIFRNSDHDRGPIVTPHAVERILCAIKELGTQRLVDHYVRTL
jgi:hypothetical protein